MNTVLSVEAWVLGITAGLVVLVAVAIRIFWRHGKTMEDE